MGRSKNLLNNDWHGSELSGEKRSPPRSPIAARKRQRWSGSHWLGRGLVVISVAILGIPTACSEGPVAPTKQNLKPSAMIVCDPSTNCGDNGINPYDSYVIGDITAQTTATYSSSTAFYDPGSGTTTNSITVSSPLENIHVESGYNPSGQTVVNSTFTDGPDQASMVNDQIVRMQSVNDYTTERNTYGASLPDDISSPMAGPTPMDMMGTLQDANVTNGALLSISGTNNASISMSQPAVISNAQAASGPEPTPASASAVKTSLIAQNPSAHIVVDQPTPTTLRITQLETASAAIGTSKTQSADAANAPLFGGPTAFGARLRPIKHIRTYKAQRGQWVIQELRTETSDSAAKQRFSSVHTLKFKNVRWQKNNQLDAARRARRPTAEVVFPAGWTGTSGALSKGVTPFMYVCEPGSPVWPDCQGGGGGGGGAGGGTDLGCAQNVAGYVNPSGQNFVFQHGFASDATTWCSLEPQMRAHYTIGYEVRHTLSSGARITTQAQDLRGRLDAERGGEGNFIFIGHSNGGLIERQLSEDAMNNNPSLVKGVLTISSPNNGLPIANVENQAVLSLLTPLAVGGCWRINHTVCKLLAESGSLLAIVAPLALNAADPVIADDRPGSSFLRSLNTGYEPYFRAGVQNYSWDRWTEFLLIGNKFGMGRALVKDADKSYHRSIDCAIISGIVGFFWAPSWTLTSVCATVAADLRGYDLVYKRLTVPGESGDALVPGSSQIYPNAASYAQFAVHDADSHLGVLAGNSSTEPQIDNAISQIFGVSRH